MPPTAEAVEHHPSVYSRGFPLLLAALSGITALSIDMSLPAMPELERAFHASVPAVQLTLSLFLMGYGAGQLVCGPPSDRLGRRPVLLAGLIAFTLAGLACSLSPSLGALIVFRFLQGAAASVGPILARAIVRDVYDHEEAAAVLSQITQIMVIAPLLAPTMGGFLLVYFGWRAIFVFLTASGAVLWLLSWAALPETVHESNRASGNVPAVGRAFGTVISDPESRRHILTICFSYSGMFAYISGSPFIFIDGFHVPERNFGLLFALTAGSLMLGAMVNRRLLETHSSARLLRRGMATTFAAAMLLLVLGGLRLGGLTGVILPMMGYLFGLGLVQPNATALAMAPHRRLAGAVSSVIGALQTLGGALAGYLVSAFYDHSPRSLAVAVGVLAALMLAMLAGSRRAEPAANAG